MMISKYIQHVLDTSTLDVNDYKMKRNQRNHILFIILFEMNKIQSDSQRSTQCIDSEHVLDTSTSDVNDNKMKWNNISFIRLVEMNKIQSDSQRSIQCIDSVFYPAVLQSNDKPMSLFYAKVV